MIQDLAEEQLGTVVLRIAEEIFRVVFLDDLTFIHEDDAVGHLAGKAHLMRNHDHSHAVLGQRHHGVQNFLDHLGIEGRCRLVEQHQLGLHAQRAGNGHTLLLAA